ncbi:hypothetical protein THAR02_05976 [Trichoderma harzianum]|uniref:Uncharacterized protein n=1 Tax=Trichoderma harzianum TaxID=5544 RepID=A0A0F9XBH8_TRIHA|nr:hypothetical protein THAR02_05976 [Trichoderma harzianum]
MVHNETMRSNRLQKQNEIIARAIGGGYVYGNNIDKDSKDIERKYVPKTEARHNQMMELYITWNYHRRQANGTLIMSPHQDVRESLSTGEFFFAGFTRSTGTVIPDDERQNIYLRGKHGEEVLVFKIDQRWVKNNRDPDNIIYSMANETDSRLRYDECSFLLSMAFADNALFDYKSYDELLEQRIPQGDDFVQLQWTKEAESLPVLRHIEADGTITAKPMHRATFERIFNAAVQNEGYLCPGGMHKVRPFSTPYTERSESLRGQLYRTYVFSKRQESISQ